MKITFEQRHLAPGTELVAHFLGGLDPPSVDAAPDCPAVSGSHGLFFCGWLAVWLGKTGDWRAGGENDCQLWEENKPVDRVSLGQRQVCLRNVIAGAEQWRVDQFCHGVGKTMAERQGGWFLSANIAPARPLCTPAAASSEGRRSINPRV